MQADDDNPFDREPWRRTLQAGGAGPSRSTDEHIRAEARRALTPRTGRWWLPASLAASLLLAVLIVQWQFEDSGAPETISESDVALRSAPVLEQGAPAASIDAPRAEDALLPRPPPPRPIPESPVRERGFAAEPSPPEAAVTGAREEREIDAKMDRQPAQQEPASVATGIAPAARSTGTGFGNLSAAKVSDLDTRTPEAWYAEIESLRAAGKLEEAEAELARLEAAHPGWLAKHHPPKP